jgi:hypothetical protein
LVVDLLVLQVLVGLAALVVVTELGMKVPQGVLVVTRAFGVLVALA